MTSPECVCVIPARYGSTRLKAKPLVRIAGKPLVRHVWERAREARVFGRIIVATDDARIRNAVSAFGGEAVMTSPRLESGTDRVAAVARRLRAEIVMNLQGDEPFIPPADLARLVEVLRRDRSCPMSTLARPTPWREICDNPNAVKIVVDSSGRAVYFSRSPVPFDAPALLGGSPAPGRRRAGAGPLLLQHLGVYCYRRRFLLRFARWPRSALEVKERLEQLRLLEYRIRPRVVVTAAPALSIDTRGDIKRANEWLRERGKRRGTG